MMTFIDKFKISKKKLDKNYFQFYQFNIYFITYSLDIS